MNIVVVFAIAACLDYLIGDPWGWPHPVQVMGWIISHYTRIALNVFKRPLVRRFAGIVLAIGSIAGTGLFSWVIIGAAYQLYFFLGVAVESILLASCFAGRSLRAAAEDVLRPLEAGDLGKARSQLSLYVGRDTQNLSEAEILRAVLETVTENAVDGVIAPLFYAIAGASVPFVGAVPFALAYKAASTLDSMVGYREEPYTDLGWFSAKLEDVLTWLPCRLTLVTLGLLSGKLGQVWLICQRDAIKDPSPNSGWSECAYAVILGVQLGGTNYYRGVAKYKPLLGNPVNPITRERIEQALQMTRRCFLIWLAIALAFAITHLRLELIDNTSLVIKYAAFLISNSFIRL